jgi:hypothetical protein
MFAPLQRVAQVRTKSEFYFEVSNGNCFLRIRNLDFFEEGRNGPSGHSANEGFNGGVEEFTWETVHGYLLFTRRGE